MAALLVVVFAATIINFTLASGVKVLLAPVTSSVMLSCDPLLRLTHNPNATATWFKDGEALGKASSDVNLVLNSSTVGSIPDDVPDIGLLQIVGIELKDEGRYWCVAEGTAGTVVRIRVVYLDSSFQTPSQLIFANVGQSVLLHCEAPDGYPEPQVRWEKDSVPLHQDNRILIGGNDLLISRATIADSGTYKCIAFNVVGLWCLTHELVVQPTDDIVRTEISASAMDSSLQQWMQVSTFVLTAILALLMTAYFVVSIFVVLTRPLNSTARRQCRCPQNFVNRCVSVTPPPPYAEFVI